MIFNFQGLLLIPVIFGGYMLQASQQESTRGEVQWKGKNWTNQQMKEALEDAGDDHLLEKKMLEQVGLNPAYGTGGFNVRAMYTLNHILITPIVKQNRELTTHIEHCYVSWVGTNKANGMNEQGKQDNRYLFSAACPLRAIFDVGGRDAIKHFQDSMNNARQAETQAFLNKYGRIIMAALDNYTITLRITLFCIAIYATIYTLYVLVPEIVKLIFGTRYRIVKEQYLSRWFKSAKQPSNISDLHYNKRITDWLLKAVASDKKRVQANLRGAHYQFSSVLLKGEPGVGKTSLVRAYAKEAGFDYIIIGGSAWSQMPEGQAIAEFLAMLKKAQANKKPVVFFIDEIDILCKKRDKSQGVACKVTSTFLENIDEARHPWIKFMFATNRWQDLDLAFMSRIAEEVHIDKPTITECKRIYRTYMRHYTTMYHLDTTFDIPQDHALRGLTGRDIKSMCSAACEQAALDGKNRVTNDSLNHFISLKKYNNQQPMHIYTWIYMLLLILLLTLIAWYMRRKRRW